MKKNNKSVFIILLIAALLVFGLWYYKKSQGGTDENNEDTGEDAGGSSGNVSFPLEDTEKKPGGSSPIDFKDGRRSVQLSDLSLSRRAVKPLDLDLHRESIGDSGSSQFDTGSSRRSSISINQNSQLSWEKW